MKYRLSTIVFFCFIFSCQEKKEDTYSINGLIQGDIPEYIYLNYGNHKDSSFVKSGKFSFHGRVLHPTLADLSISPISTMENPFYIENSEIEIEISVEKKDHKGMEIHFITVNNLEGTNTILIQKDFEKFLNLTKEDSNKNLMVFEKLSSVIEQYPKHSYSANLLAQFAVDSTFNVNQLENLLNKLDPENPSLASIVKVKNIINPVNDLIVGNTIFDFELRNQKDEMIYTTAFRGKILLIDFWASWCIPCRKQNPDLLKIHNEFNGKGFEILGVSLDKDKDKWLSAIKEDKLIWHNVLDQEGFGGKVASNYKVTFLPYNMLIDKEGKIIAIDVKMSELNSTLKNNFD